MLTPAHPAQPASIPLTARETDVLEWILDGKSDSTIGAILGVSPKTVNFHVENAKRKLGAASRVRAVLIAVSTGQIRYTEDRPHEDDPRRARLRPHAPQSHAAVAALVL